MNNNSERQYGECLAGSYIKFETWNGYYLLI